MGLNGGQSGQLIIIHNINCPLFIDKSSLNLQESDKIVTGSDGMEWIKYRRFIAKPNTFLQKATNKYKIQRFNNIILSKNYILHCEAKNIFSFSNKHIHIQ